jgi:transcriptional regulator with XRE-family HTH domain
MITMFRRLLKEILKKEGVKNCQVCRNLKINEGQLSCFFSGKKGISIKKLEQIVDFLDYEILLFKKSELGRKQHKKKLIEAGKIAEKEIGRIIQQFEENFQVTVKDIEVFGARAKINYETWEDKIGEPS